MKINRIHGKTKQGKAIFDTTETLSGKGKSSRRNSAESPLLSVRTSHPHPQPLSNHSNCFPRRRSLCAGAAAVSRRHVWPLNFSPEIVFLYLNVATQESTKFPCDRMCSSLLICAPFYECHFEKHTRRNDRGEFAQNMT